MIQKTVQIGDPRVRAKSKNVKLADIPSKKIQQLIENLVDSMRHHNLIGMAAPQLGVNLNVFVSEIRDTNVRKNVIPDPVRVFINPKFVSLSRAQADMIEGCGSVDYGNIHGPVRRHVSAVIQSYNELGELVVLKTTGLLAHIMQHEYDHLQGVLCIDKFTDTRKIFHIEMRKKQ